MAIPFSFLPFLTELHLQFSMYIFFCFVLIRKMMRTLFDEFLINSLINERKGGISGGYRHVAKVPRVDYFDMSWPTNKCLPVSRPFFSFLTDLPGAHAGTRRRQPLPSLPLFIHPLMCLFSLLRCTCPAWRFQTERRGRRHSAIRHA